MATGTVYSTPARPLPRNSLSRGAFKFKKSPKHCSWKCTALIAVGIAVVLSIILCYCIGKASIKLWSLIDFKIWFGQVQKEKFSWLFSKIKRSEKRKPATTQITQLKQLWKENVKFINHVILLICFTLHTWMCLILSLRLIMKIYDLTWSCSQMSEALFRPTPLKNNRSCLSFPSYPQALTRVPLLSFAF